MKLSIASFDHPVVFLVALVLALVPILYGLVTLARKAQVPVPLPAFDQQQ